EPQDTVSGKELAKAGPKLEQALIIGRVQTPPAGSRPLNHVAVFTVEGEDEPAFSKVAAKLVKSAPSGSLNIARRGPEKHLDPARSQGRHRFDRGEQVLLPLRDRCAKEPVVDIGAASNRPDLFAQR